MMWLSVFFMYALLYFSQLHQSIRFRISLGKHAYSNILEISPPKTESFQIKILIFFVFVLKTWIVGTR